MLLRSIALTALAAIAFLAGLGFGPAVPQCQEDEAIVGVGDFTRDHGWDHLVCIPIDNLEVH